MIDLKPCPFCGKKPHVYSLEAHDGCVSKLEIDCCIRFEIEPSYMIYTEGGTEKRFYPSGDAVEVWNRRSR